MKIVKGTTGDADILALILSEANKDVAKKFNITQENTPKHPSFYTPEWVLSDFNRGEEYYLCKEKKIIRGCVAFESPHPATSYLNRLAVLPAYRHNGIGEYLVKHICDYSKSKNIQTVSVGIIAEHLVLKNWYLKLGFAEAGTKRFDHLPFNVLFMEYHIDN